MSEVLRVGKAEREGAKAALDGAQRASIVLRELGEDAAAAVMRHMDESVIGAITASVLPSSKITAELRNDVMRGFADEIGANANSGLGYLSRVLSAALGEKRAKEIIQRLGGKRGRAAAQFAANADPRLLAHVVVTERPQTLALLLAQLPHDTGAAMLSFLPEPLVADTLFRFTTLDTVSAIAVNELRMMMGELLASDEVSSRRLSNLGGAKRTADILNHLQAGMSERVMELIEARDPGTAETIRENLFTFSDLVRLSDRSLQILLREVPTERLAPSLRLEDEDTRNRFYKNMSSRSVEVLREELRSGPPMRKSDALAAQGEVVEIALRLAGEGRIAIGAAEELI
jgi:flagellar motor switch protein FliG